MWKLTVQAYPKSDKDFYYFKIKNWEKGWQKGNSASVWN